MTSSERPRGPEDHLKGEALLQWVYDNYELVGSRAASRLGIDRYGINRDDFCAELRDRTIDKIFNGSFDLGRSIEHYMHGIAARLPYEMLRRSVRDRKAVESESNKWYERLKATAAEPDPPNPWPDDDGLFVAAMVDDSPATMMDLEERAIRALLEENAAVRQSLHDEAEYEADDRNYGRVRELLRRLACRDIFETCCPPDRLLIYRHFWKGQSVTGYARELGMQPDCLHQRLSRLYATIRSRFAVLCLEFGMPAPAD